MFYECCNYNRGKQSQAALSLSREVLNLPIALTRISL